jgi:EAL domain-containing protein (putative c-di-GMP-specific phosphodiesterase class I)/FixJ family two-component response regulator
MTSSPLTTSLDAAPATTSEEDLRTGRLLIVDDERGTREVFSAILSNAGYEVELATGGRDGIAKAARSPFDLAIVDFDMPHTDGITVLGELRELQPQCQRVLCSGNLNVPMIMDAVNRGEINRVLAKPVRAGRLLQIVGESLEVRRRRKGILVDLGQPHAEQQLQDLRDCINGNQLTMALQPIVTPEGKVAAFEGLLRSAHPRLDSPVAVLRAAEDLDMLDELAAVIARLAVGKLEQLDGSWKLFINAHPKELMEPELLSNRLKILENWRDRLVVEITERTYVLELSEWAASVELLTQAGFELAVDDLGAGYNSLIVLAELQPHYLKVDMSMTRNVDSDPRKQRLIEMLVKFANSTDAIVISEGIETAAEAKALRSCGVHLMQGYYFGRPTTDIELSREHLAADSLIKPS